MIFFSGHELCWRSRYGEWVNITPKMHCSMTKLRFQFLHKTKNSSNWCAQQSYGIPCKMANLIFLTLYFLLKLTYFIGPGRVAQSVGHLTRKSGVLGSIPGLATYFRFSFRFFKKGSCHLLAKVCARSTG